LQKGYDIRRRTLEEVAKLLNLALEIKLLRGNRNLWQVKLEKLSLYDNNPLKKKYVICRADNPNAALSKLCQRISYRMVVAPQLNGPDKIVTLGEVVKGSLYLRQNEGI
jgi:hypothetical protein